MSFQLDAFFNKLSDGDVIIAYKGNISTPVINDILDKVEANLIERDESPKIQKKIYNVLVEGMQNLFHHSEGMPDEYKAEYKEKLGMLIVRKKDDGYLVSFGNFVDTRQKEYLQEKIEKINSLSIDELKEMYKFILNHQKLSAKGGGGLGLLDMAKKTKSKLEYEFLGHNTNWHFYNLNIFVQ
jgi:hypothetical protein